MSGPPTTFSLHFLGLPNFCRVRYWWNASRRQFEYSRSEGGNEQSRAAQPDDAAWETFRRILDALRAWQWQAGYANPGILDGEHWSLAIAWDDQHLNSGGDNAYPPGFAVLRRAVDCLRDGSLPLYAPSLLEAAATAAQAQAGPEAALRELMQKLQNAEGSWLNHEDERALVDLVKLLGLKALPAVPLLLQALAGPGGAKRHYLVRDSLDHIVQAAESLDADNQEVRRLGRPVVPAILPILHQPEADREIRRPLVQLLRCIGLEEEAAISAVVACLRTQDTHLIDSACFALEAWNVRPPAALPVLLATLRERIAAGNWAYSEQVARALVRLCGPAAAAQALPMLLEALQQAHPEGRAVAAANLSALGTAAGPAVPLLTAALSDSFATLRWQAVEALGAIGPESRAAVPLLLDKLRDSDYVVRARVPRALAQISPDSPSIIEPLVEALHDESVRQETGRVLGTLGPNFPDLGDVRTIVRYVSQHTLERKLRLFAVACCRSVWELLTDERSRHAVEVAERYADGAASQEELTAALDAARAALASCRGEHHERTALAAACLAAAPLAGATAELARIVAALPDQTTIRMLAYELLFDYSFLPAIHLQRAWLNWHDGLVRSLAQSIYDQRRFEDMPVLADALMEAGCADDHILNHCRQQRLHARGCRVLDAVLREKSSYFGR